MALSHKQVSSDLFDEVKRLQRENSCLKSWRSQDQRRIQRLEDLLAQSDIILAAAGVDRGAPVRVNIQGVLKS